MKKSLVTVLALFLMTFGVTAQDEQIVWQKDFKKASALSRESGKPMVLDFTAPWCKPCKIMDEQFWVRTDVVQAMKPFIAVKVDFDEEKGLAGRYGIRAIPFVVFSDPLGNMITFRRGFSGKNARELNQIFEEMPKDFSALKKNYAALDLKKDDGAALLEIADWYGKSKMLGLGNEFYKRALKTKEIQSDAEKRERISAGIGLNYYSLKDFEQAAAYLEDYLKDYPSTKRKEIVFSALAISHANRGKMKDADKYLEMLKAEFPASKNIPTVAGAIENAKNKPGK